MPIPKLPPFNEVTRHNLGIMHLALRHILDRAHFVALDTEFTGLGPRKETRSSDMKDRYDHLAKVARTYALVSFGVAVFERIPSVTNENEDSSSAGDITNYAVHNFNFTLLRSDDYTVSTSSLSFLHDSGFDFNRHLREGIPYTPGNDPDKLDPTDSDTILRSLFLHILTRRVPIVLHNGLLDLLFLYHALYASLPSTLETFVHDLSDMVGFAGVFDTKHIAEVETRESASFLAYLYDSEREQGRRKEEHKRCFECVIKDRLPIPLKSTVTPKADTDGTGEGARTENGLENGKKRKGVFNTGKPYCEQYAAHGYCNAGKNCSRPHDLDLILDDELGASSRNSKRPRHSTSTPERTPAHAQPSRLPLSVPPPAPPTAQADFESYHSATFDAFMTGYIFAHQINTIEKWQEHKNRVYLMGKQIPLRIERSAFTKGSVDHRKKMEAHLAANRRILGARDSY
ncbi:ribonuclease CAF1 [Cladochytrium replicatum]|nr:ribonuclease CAF1 [Cladochytrium replicatum]